MKRRNFFKIMAGSVGAAIVVPEVLRKNNPAPKESSFLKLDDTPKSIIPMPSDIIHPVFSVVQTGESETRELIYLSLEDGNIDDYQHYFHFNDAVLVGDKTEQSMYIVSGMWIVGMADCPCTIGLKIIPFLELGTYRKAQEGDYLVLAYNSFAKDRLTGKII